MNPTVDQSAPGTAVKFPRSSKEIIAKALHAELPKGRQHRAVREVGVVLTGYLQRCQDRAFQGLSKNAAEKMLGAATELRRLLSEAPWTLALDTGIWNFLPQLDALVEYLEDPARPGLRPGPNRDEARDLIGRLAVVFLEYYPHQEKNVGRYAILHKDLDLFLHECLKLVGVTVPTGTPWRRDWVLPALKWARARRQKLRELPKAAEPDINK